MDDIHAQTEVVIAALEAGLRLWSFTDRDGYSSGYCCKDGVLFTMFMHATDNTPHLTRISRERLRDLLRDGLQAAPNRFVHREAQDMVRQARAHIEAAQDEL